MNFSIETPRLLLRDFQEADWTAVHAYAANPEVTRHMNWGPNTEADTRAFVAQAIALGQRQPRRTYHLAVVAKETGALVGGATLRMLDSDPLSGELGYTLHPAAWGKGYATELARAVITFGFKDLNLRRIWATCRPENLASYRILRKVGLAFEEYLQNERQVRGHWVDCFLCGLSREAWLRGGAPAPAAGPSKNGH
jgi:RimJ/RimL family protein N-acetyltransferase